MLTSLRKDGQKRFETQHRAPRPVLTIRRRPGWRQGFCSAPRTRAASPQRPRAVPPPSTSAPFEILKSVTGHSVRRHLYHAEWVTQAAGTQVSSPESGPLQSRDMGTDMLLRGRHSRAWADKRGHQQVWRAQTVRLQYFTTCSRFRVMICVSTWNAWSTDEEENFWTMAKAPAVHCKSFLNSTCFGKIPMTNYRRSLIHLESTPVAFVIIFGVHLHSQ